MPNKESQPIQNQKLKIRQPILPAHKVPGRTLSFRFCDRLRNFAQHQTQPVHSVTAGGSWNKDRTHNEHHTTVYVDVADVCKDRSISDSERVAIGSKLKDLADVSVVIRESGSCVGRILKECRTLVASDFDNAIAIQEHWLSEIAKVSSDESFARVVHRNENAAERKFDLFPDFAARAKRLRRNLTLTSAEHQVVSNRSRGHRDK
ncbi:hypothetical protein [Mesorhizobium sp. IMUNJ 23232]|uniref:hypothetical protein n=1 Tax=Mesorhizobium sp. IMUNJ 23232 TaxID=3376064 RepID=UPI0037C67968